MITPEAFKSWFTEYSKTEVNNWPTAAQWHLVCKMVARMEVDEPDEPDTILTIKDGEVTATSVDPGC
jgi:hypothetical protein